MQRVRIGLTGLAFVFLAVLLAAIVTSRPAGEAPITANLIAQQKAGAAAVQPVQAPAGPPPRPPPHTGGPPAGRPRRRGGGARERRFERGGRRRSAALR